MAVRLAKARGVKEVVVALVSTVKAAVGLDEAGLDAGAGAEGGLEAATRATAAFAGIVVIVVRAAAAVSVAVAATNAGAARAKKNLTEGSGVEE